MKELNKTREGLVNTDNKVVIVELVLHMAGLPGDFVSLKKTSSKFFFFVKFFLVLSKVNNREDV